MTVFVKTQRAVCLIGVNFPICKFYPNKPDFKEKTYIIEKFRDRVRQALFQSSCPSPGPQFYFPHKM